MTGLFSGRFDDPHLGHWGSILKLLKVFEKLKVVVLDYDGRAHSAYYVARVFETLAVLSNIDKDRLQVLVNKTHFAKMERSEWSAYEADIYIGGNQEVNDHMRSKFIPVLEWDRTFDFSARNYKKESIMDNP